MLYGDFSAGREGDAWQLIPTAWVEAAQARWRERIKPATPLSAIGVDVARGGKDRTILSPRYDNYFASQICYPGTATPDGPAVVQYALLARGTSQAVVNVDVIGVGTSVYDGLKAFIGNAVIPLNGSEASDARDKTGQLGFINQRAEWYWSLREALDPTTGQDLAIPDDRELAADLCSVRFKMAVRGIQIESKDDIIKRIGRSPDKGDSLVYANAIKHMPGAGWMGFFEAQAAQAKKSTEQPK
jgi:hypothetical protein